MSLVPLCEAELPIQQTPHEKPHLHTQVLLTLPGVESSLLAQHHCCHWGLWMAKAKSERMSREGQILGV